MRRARGAQEGGEATGLSQGRGQQRPPEMGALRGGDGSSSSPGMGGRGADRLASPPSKCVKGAERKLGPQRSKTTMWGPHFSSPSLTPAPGGSWRHLGNAQWQVGGQTGGRRER